MVPDSYHDFFVALAGVGGALVGLLFVAISVASERVTGAHASAVEQARATGALTAFLVPVTVALVALIPGQGVAVAAVVSGGAGLLSTAASARRSAAGAPRRRDAVRRVVSAVGLAVVMLLDLLDGIRLLVDPGSRSAVGALAVLALVSLLLGVDRAWLLIGARDRGTLAAVRDLVLPGRTQPGGAAPADQGGRAHADGDGGADRD